MGVKTLRVLMAIVFVAAVAAVAASVVVIKQSNRIASIERKVSSGSLDQVATQADRDSHNKHFALTMSPSDRLDGVLLKDRSGFILGGTLSKAPNGTVYQLWAQTGTGPISLGVLGDDANKSFAFYAPAVTERLFVTFEDPMGAVAPNPTAAVVAGALPK
jgi:HAMP domain-containing protein